MQLSGIDLNLLVALDALLQERNVSRAARRVGLSASAMSHALKRLRDTFNDPILVRSGRSMLPTPRAEALTDQVRRAVLEAERVFSRVREFDPGSLDRVFRIAACDLAVVVIGPALEQILRVEAPNVVVDYRPLPDVAGPLRDGSCDIALGTFTAPFADIEHRTLFTDQCVCVVRTENRRVGERVRLDDLLQLLHLDVEAEIERLRGLDAALVPYQIERRVARTVPSYLAALHLVARTDYMTVLPSCLARAMQQVLRLKVLPSPLEIDPVAVSLSWHARDQEQPEHRWLREAVGRAVALSV